VHAPAPSLFEGTQLGCRAVDKTNRQIKADVERRLPNLNIELIFDVGAHLGETCTVLREYYPQAEIWAFEPVPKTYGELEEIAGDIPRIHLLNHALGAVDGSARMEARGTSGNNRVIEDDEEAKRVRDVPIARGDTFCDERGIERIDYLKIDTEGHDLQVLRGFQKMLSDFKVDLVEIEAGMNARNTKHVPLERFKGYLEPMGYFIFRLYEQAPEFRGVPNLRRCNVVFMSNPTIEANTIPKK
jgi:FkbM family methyltransferase